MNKVDKCVSCGATRILKGDYCKRCNREQLFVKENKE